MREMQPFRSPRPRAAPPRANGRDDGFMSPISLDRAYPARIVVRLRSIDFGSTFSPSSMGIMKTIAATPDSPDFSLQLEVRPRRLAISFSIPIESKNRRRYKMEINLSLVKKIHHVPEKDGRHILVLPLQFPPQYYRENPDVPPTMLQPFQNWGRRENWYRATDIAENLEISRRFPIAVHNDIPDPGYMEIGRWTTIRLVLEGENEAMEAAFGQIIMALEDLNVTIETHDDFAVQRDTSSIWDHINHPRDEPDGLALALLHKHHSQCIPLDFTVRYQLEACISCGILNEHTLSVEFLQKVASLDPSDATRRLEYLADQNKTLYDPMPLFISNDAKNYIPHLKLHQHCTLVRRAVITPTTIRFHTPTLEASNRVLRKYSHLQDRFLRVQFAEETEKGRISRNSTTNEDIWVRILRALYWGIQIGDRRYEFLGFGNSQLRQCGAYFFCPTNHVSCDDIRQWMGHFSHIRVVAKYAARLGQCFSTTREMKGIPTPHIRRIPDIERNGHCFSDGVGIISEFTARMIIDELKLNVFSEPCAFQFRMGGCKGVLVVWPQAKLQEVHIRDSQEKFQAKFNQLEIIKAATYSTATLNRQTITILECLGVRTKAFVDLLEYQINLYEQAMVCNTTAVDMLTKFVDENQSTLIVAELIRAGFKTGEFQEPFVMNLVNLWRSWSLKLLKEKARIVVEKSAFVLGCVDETGTLKGHFESTEGSLGKDVTKLPEIFLQLSDPKQYNKTTIIKTVCIVGRNPSLHPGDIRVVRAVDNPRLRHLRDVVVFPSTGDRPVPSMLSGGDLDGDDFFVIWDPDLMPREWNHPAMNYVATRPAELDEDVQVDDLRDFFVNYMKNDVLGLIAHSHLAFADSLGPKHGKCLQLAQLHSKAVDYPKTGDPASCGPEFTIKEWPHFMEKRNSYRSSKALGVIYDRTVRQTIEFTPGWERAFDQRIIKSFELDDQILEEARNIKSLYDTSVRRVLSQHDVATEFELYTGWAMSKPAIGSDYKRQEDLAREYGTLKLRYRDMCSEAAGRYDEPKMERFVAAMYKVTEEEVKAALIQHNRLPPVDVGGSIESQKLEVNSMPLISFPWIFHRVMAQIATGGKSGHDTSSASASRHQVPLTQVSSAQKGNQDISNEPGLQTQPQVPMFSTTLDYEETDKSDMLSPAAIATLEREEDVAPVRQQVQNTSDDDNLGPQKDAEAFLAPNSTSVAAMDNFAGNFDSEDE